jgi:hypothetical protein
MDETELRFVMENNGPLSTKITETETCVLTVHPRVGLKHCRPSQSLVSQAWELPRLPPVPPASPPSAPGQDESPDTNSGNIDEPDYEFSVGPAPLDIDLELSVSNILSGKRQRKQSSRDFDAAKSKRAKKGSPEP